jgi:nitroimidazol reductase NimA-like FMN-containing flavoprotein (pyridoxamine 5'-phosphate oxidase superfamily)
MANQPDMRFRRLRKKGSRDLDLACEIIDAARICHVGFTLNDQPYVIPMALARDATRVLLHGSIASRLMKSLAGGLPCCVTVTLLDGLVLARSAFNSSMNYRCVMIFGQAVAVTANEDKIRGLELLTEHLMPGRTKELRPSTRKELNATALLSLPLESYTVKVSDSPPDDPAGDMDAPVWAGVLPLRMKAGRPQPAPDMQKPMPPPAYMKKWNFD